MEINLELFKHQRDFVFSESRHSALIAGYGAGKTFGGICKAVIMKLKYSGIPIAYYLPTYGLIRDIAFPKFAEIFEMFDIPYKLNKSDKDFWTPYGMIHLRSMDSPESIIGYEVGYSLIDETDILPKAKMSEVFKMIIARNRKPLPDGTENKTDVVGTPEGFKWAYDFFVKNSTGDRRIIKGSTMYNTTLPDSYIQTLKDVYTDEQLMAYLDGEFVNLTSGSVYKTFKRNIHHTDRTIEPNDTLHIGMDFNVTNMHAVTNVVDVIAGEQVYSAVDEIVKAYDTFDICEIIKERYPRHRIIVYPDASGSAQKTSSSKTDHQILRDSGFIVRSKKKNPFVKDRVNAVNSALKKNKLLVNTDKCPVLTEALENQTYKNGEPDKDGGYDHITEAEGYFVSYNHQTKPVSADIDF